MKKFLLFFAPLACTALLTSCFFGLCFTHIKSAEYSDSAHFTASFSGTTSCLDKEKISVYGKLGEARIEHTITGFWIVPFVGYKFEVTPNFQSGETVTVYANSTWYCDLDHYHTMNGEGTFVVPEL